jgi:HEPN domain-containing protein
MKEIRDRKDWIVRAEQDLQAIGALVSLPEPLWEIAGFHAQQASEKFLKAFLVHNGWTLKKTHNLNDPLTDCLQYDSSLSELSGDCTLVTPFAMAGRYARPHTVTRSTCEAAIAAAKRIRAEILKRLS